MGSLKVTNNARGQLATGIAADAVALSVKAGEGAEFPSLSAGEFFYCTLQKADGSNEIIKVTARTGDTFTTIVRAQDNTTAKAFIADDIVSLRPVAAVIEYLRAIEEGTVSTTWQLNKGASGPKLKDSSGELQIRNAADAADANLKAALVTISGTPSASTHATTKGVLDTHAALTGSGAHGLGTISTQSASAVVITGGSASLDNESANVSIKARDHGTATTPEVVNVVYGTGSPPTASGVPIGTIFLKYV